MLKYSFPVKKNELPCGLNTFMLNYKVTFISEIVPEKKKRKKEGKKEIEI